MAFEGGDPMVADVFACLGFTEVVACNLDSSTITDAGERQQKIGAMVTSGNVGPQVHLAEIWVFSVAKVFSIIDATANQF